jgi:hypothetical protein
MDLRFANRWCRENRWLLQEWEQVGRLERKMSLQFASVLD